MSDNSLDRPGTSRQTVIDLALLVNLINPGTLYDFQTALTTTKVPPTTSVWRQFISALAWLADARRGGESVTAVCGVQIDGEFKLLLTSNCVVKKDVADHVRYVLRVLQEMIKGEWNDCGTVLEDIITASVYLSRNKVQNYSCRLSKLVQKIKDDVERPSLTPGKQTITPAQGFVLTQHRRSIAP